MYRELHFHSIFLRFAYLDAAPAFGVARIARRDMHLPCRGPNGAPHDLAVPKGTYILMDIMGIGLSPLHLVLLCTHRVN
jgi:hypothetical protein